MVSDAFFGYRHIVVQPCAFSAKWHHYVARVVICRVIPQQRTPTVRLQWPTVVEAALRPRLAKWCVVDGWCSGLGWLNGVWGMAAYAVEDY